MKPNRGTTDLLPSTPVVEDVAFDANGELNVRHST